MSTSAPTPGRRRDDIGPRDFPDDLAVGDYWRPSPFHGWRVVCPMLNGGFSIANLGGHSIVEHEDGTITVSPSILVTGSDGEQWHGFLEHGVLRTA